MMVQLIKKGGLRERANRSRSYVGSENTATTLKPNKYTATPNTETKSAATTFPKADISKQD
jgi:hypothetical protein